MVNLYMKIDFLDWAWTFPPFLFAWVMYLSLANKWKVKMPITSESELQSTTSSSH